tara:strand:- start:65365 stop:65511 length:147 start_codon:yes stop_codon:yes gene_type:complete
MHDVKHLCNRSQDEFPTPTIAHVAYLAGLLSGALISVMIASMYLVATS